MVDAAAGDIGSYTAVLVMDFSGDLDDSVGGGSDCFSFSNNLALVTLLSGSLVTGLITLIGLLSRTARIDLSTRGLTPFTGLVMEDRFFLLALGVLMTDTFGGETLSLETDLFGDNLDLSLRDSANLSSSLSALVLTGLLPDLVMVAGYVDCNFLIFN